MEQANSPAAAPAREARRAALLLSALALAACAGPGAGPLPERAVFPGFDTSRYPGDAALRTWRAQSPYQWVGYYLPAPCHRDASWSGKRAALERQGWGIAILYVGQQTFEDVPEQDSAAVPPDSIVCSRTLLTAEQGERDARDAADRAAAEGFPPGSVIFLDVERMRQVPPAMMAYYQAWLRGIVRDGRFRPGTYAHRANAAELYLLAQTALRGSGSQVEPRFWVAGGGGFSLTSHPERSGAPYADVWQGALNVERDWGGVRLHIDENTASLPSPSAPDAG